MDPSGFANKRWEDQVAPPCQESEGQTAQYALSMPDTPSVQQEPDMHSQRGPQMSLTHRYKKYLHLLDAQAVYTHPPHKHTQACTHLSVVTKGSTTYLWGGRPGRNLTSAWSSCSSRRPLMTWGLRVRAVARAFSCWALLKRAMQVPFASFAGLRHSIGPAAGTTCGCIS